MKAYRTWKDNGEVEALELPDAKERVRSFHGYSERTLDEIIAMGLPALFQTNGCWYEFVEDGQAPRPVGQ